MIIDKPPAQGTSSSSFVFFFKRIKQHTVPVLEVDGVFIADSHTSWSTEKMVAAIQRIWKNVHSCIFTMVIFSFAHVFYTSWFFAWNHRKFQQIVLSQFKLFGISWSGGLMYKVLPFKAANSNSKMQISNKME